MASRHHIDIQAISASFLVIAFLLGGSSHVANGFKVNLQLYSDYSQEGDHLYFETKLPNLTAYKDLLPKFQHICGMGCWLGYNGYNFTDQVNSYFMGSYYTNTSLCQSRNITSIKSLRFLGSSEPSNISLSLYEGTFYTGKETLTEGRVLTGITSKTLSLLSTGGVGSEWSLFEGQQLNGNSYCFPAPFSNSFSYNFAGTLDPVWNLVTIGSVFKGCDIAEIQEYKQSNNM